MYPLPLGLQMAAQEEKHGADYLVTVHSDKGSRIFIN